MRHEENGHAGVAHLVDLAHAALAKIDIAYGEGLIDEQDLGFHVDGDGKGQAHAHAARVSLYRLIDELANLGELFDLWKLRVDFTAREAEDRGVHVDVLASGEFLIEARAQFKQCCDAAVDGNFAFGGMQYARDDL